MKRFQLVVLVSAIAAGAIWWGFYRTHHTSSLAVASLLPKETLAIVHLPDFNRSRADWHRTDLYQLWKEPAVQDFLAKPRAQVPTQGRIGQTVEEIDSIQMKDAFVAVVAVEFSAWKWVGGFRSTGDAENAEKTVESWRAQLLGERDHFGGMEKLFRRGVRASGKLAGEYAMAIAFHRAARERSGEGQDNRGGDDDREWGHR